MPQIVLARRGKLCNYVSSLGRQAMNTQRKIEALKTEFPAVWKAAKQGGKSDEQALADIKRASDLAAVIRSVGE
jgi:hypothetical protein